MSKGTTLMLDKLHLKAQKNFDGSIGLMEFFLRTILRLIACNMGKNWFNFEGTLFQSEGITLDTCKIELTYQMLPLFMKPPGKIELAFETDLMF